MAGNIPLRHYKTSEILSRFTKLAQTSQYYVHLAALTETVAGGTKGAGAQQTFSQMLSSVGIDQSFVSGDIGMYCNEASLPGNSFATTEMTTDFPGVSQKFPYRKIYNDLQLTFYVDDQYKILRFFEAWMSYIASPYGLGKAIYEDNGQTGSFRFNYPSAYKCNIYVAKFNKDETLANRVAYQFINAFPIDITSMPVSYDSSDTLKCTISFSYDRYIFDPSGKLIAAVTPPPAPNLPTSQANPELIIPPTTPEGAVYNDFLNGTTQINGRGIGNKNFDQFRGGAQVGTGSEEGFLA